MREDLPDDRRIGQGADQAQPAPQCGHVRTSMANARCMRAAQLQARELLFPPGPSGTWSQRRCRGREPRYPSVGDHALAPARSRGRQPVADGAGWFPAAASSLPDAPTLQRLEHKLPRAVVPRRLELQRDTAVAPEPQALLREGRAQARTGTGAPAPPGRVAATHTLACRSKPSRCACRGPRGVPVGVSRASPSRRTRAPARAPSTTRPWTEAPTIPASAGDSSASRSAGRVASSTGSRPWRRG